MKMTMTTKMKISMVVIAIQVTVILFTKCFVANAGSDNIYVPLSIPLLFLWSQDCACVLFFSSTLLVYVFYLAFLIVVL